MTRTELAEHYRKTEGGKLLLRHGRWKYIVRTAEGDRFSEGKTWEDAVLKGREPATEEG